MKTGATAFVGIVVLTLAFILGRASVQRPTGDGATDDGPSRTVMLDQRGVALPRWNHGAYDDPELLTELDELIEQIRKSPMNDRFRAAVVDLVGAQYPPAVDALLEQGSLSEELTGKCLERFGRNATIELTTAVGCWRLVSKVARTLQIPLESGIASWPPDGRQPGDGAGS